MIQQFQTSLNNFKQMTNKSNRSWLWFLGAFLLWLASYFVIRFIFKLEKGDAGTFGDQFGAINALFTGLSFAGIIITLRLQQEELSAQRREFMTSRAMTIVYKQIELVTTVISTASYTVLNLNRWVNQNEPNEEFKGMDAILKSRRMINQDNFESELTKYIEIMKPILLSVSNSTSLLIRIRENEKMSDADSLIIYEAFKYNLNSKLWENIDYIYYLYKSDKNEENKDILTYISSINAFNEIINELHSKNL